MAKLTEIVDVLSQENEKIKEILQANLVIESTPVKDVKRLSELPAASVEHLKRLITRAASLKRGSRDEDIPTHWTNALELVHWAYDMSKIERPEPYMRNAWKQYEDVLAHAVKMLARFRGLNGSWRLSTIDADLRS